MFVGTFDKTEVEATAAVIVGVLAMNGDTWRTAGWAELADGFGQLVAAPGMWRDWFNNPFIKIDQHGLVSRGFAEFVGNHGIQFTDKGLERMAKWVPGTANAKDGAQEHPAGGTK